MLDMTDCGNLKVNLSRQRLICDSGGHTVWETIQTPVTLVARKTALLLCDVWDRHWCRGACERLERLVPRMNALAKNLRARGVQIVHAAGDVMEPYAASPACRRVLAVPPVAPPPDREHPAPPGPLDPHNTQGLTGGSDTVGSDFGAVNQRLWSRLHPGIDIDEATDAISDSGRELYSFYRHHGIRTIFIMGVHTNACVMARSFGIIQSVKWGLDINLVRDLTDAMYSPASLPYVSHEEGTRLFVDYIEKFWCPTITSAELLKTDGEAHSSTKQA